MASFVPLKDVSIQDISVILNNLNFSALVDPFLTNGVSGKAISRIKSYQSIMDIGKGQINEFVAETFYEDFVVEWKSTGLVPKDLLQQNLVASLDFKVDKYLRFVILVTVFCSAYLVYLHQGNGILSSNGDQTSSAVSLLCNCSISIRLMQLYSGLYQRGRRGNVGEHG